MDKILNDYLEKVDKYLKPMKVTDRMDIIKERHGRAERAWRAFGK